MPCETGPPVVFGLLDSMRRPTFFNPWDMIHLLSGIVVSVFLRLILNGIDDGLLYVVALVIHSAYELGDVQRRVVYGECTKSLWDTAGDTVSFSFGFLFGLAVPPTKAAPPPYPPAILLLK